MRRVSKVVCYIVGDGKLLVFRQPKFPEAGLQVPAGTIEPGETPEEAAKREVVEETGLTGFRLLGKLGCYEFDMSQWKPEIHERHVFAFEVIAPTNVAWTHLETGGQKGPGYGIEFEFSWSDFQHRDPGLIADLGRFLPQLKAVLTRDWRLRAVLEESLPIRPCAPRDAIQAEVDPLGLADDVLSLKPRDQRRGH